MEMKIEIEKLKIGAVRSGNAAARAETHIGELEERLMRFARPLTLRDDAGAPNLAVRDVAVALAAENGVAINKVADVTNTIVQLIDKNEESPCATVFLIYCFRFFLTSWQRTFRGGGTSWQRTFRGKSLKSVHLWGPQHGAPRASRTPRSA